MAAAVDTEGEVRLEQSIPGRIVVAGWPDSSLSEIVDLLQRIGPASWSVRSGEACGVNPFRERLVIPPNPGDVDWLREELGHDDGAVLLLFIENAQTLLARKLSEGAPLQESAKEWHAAADRLLRLAEGSDDRVKVIAADEAVSAPASFTDYLSGVCRLPLSFKSEVGVRTRFKWDDFFLMVAGQFLQEQRDLRALARDLQQRRDFRPGGRPNLRVDWSAVLADVSAMRRENCALVELLHRLQMTLEQNMLELKNQEEAARDLARQLQARDEEMARLKSQLLNSTRDVDQLKASLDALQRSTSWKITEPIRTGVRFCRGLARRWQG